VIYDRPVYQLMRDAADQLSEPFTSAAIIQWFAAHYPKIKRGTITAHIRGMTSNDPSRRHFPGLAAKEPAFFRDEDGQLIRFDPDTHTGEEEASVLGEDGDEGVAEAASPEAVAEFVLESHLEEFLLGNWNKIKWGRPLRIWDDGAGVTGHQYNTDVGRLDFLCVDESTNTLVVVELKRGRPADRVVGQVARYIGWIRIHLAQPGQAVEGLIVAHEAGDQLMYAAEALPALSIMTYELTFQLQTAELPQGNTNATLTA
jgi:hypothetical protein